MVAPSGTLSGLVADLQPRPARPALVIGAMVGAPILLLAIVIAVWIGTQAPADATSVAAIAAPPPASPPVVAVTPPVVAPAPTTDRPALGDSRADLPLGADLPEAVEPSHAPSASHDATPSRPVAHGARPSTSTATTPRTTEATARRAPPDDRPAAATTRIQILALGTWAHVRIDGHEVGQTPYNGDVAVGSHAIELVTDDGRTFSARPTATEGTLLRVTHRFE
jgi:hypothetical protein